MTTPQVTASKFWAGLFDFKFKTFITLKFISVIYAIIMGVIALGGLITFVAMAYQGTGTAVLGLFLVPAFMLIYVLAARLWLELVAVIFRIGENTTKLVEQDRVA